VTDRVSGDTEAGLYGFGSDGVGYGDDGGLVHAPHIANLVSKRQANSGSLRQLNWRGTFPAMPNAAHPYADIAERLLWHRTMLGLTQDQYATKIGTKRAAYSLWEAGSHRLSLNGALALRKTFGLSLDFMFEGIDDALPMTLRNAWRDRPSVKS
jgi:DNA-binding XRE family transcriptional regulator